MPAKQQTPLKIFVLKSVEAVFFQWNALFLASRSSRESFLHVKQHFKVK